MLEIAVLLKKTRLLVTPFLRLDNVINNGDTIVSTALVVGLVVYSFGLVAFRIESTSGERL